MKNLSGFNSFFYTRENSDHTQLSVDKRQHRPTDVWQWQELPVSVQITLMRC